MRSDYVFSFSGEGGKKALAEVDLSFKLQDAANLNGIHTAMVLAAHWPNFHTDLQAISAAYPKTNIKVQEFSSESSWEQVHYYLGGRHHLEANDGWTPPDDELVFEAMAAAQPGQDVVIAKNQSSINTRMRGLLEEAFTKSGRSWDDHLKLAYRATMATVESIPEPTPYRLFVVGHGPALENLKSQVLDKTPGLSDLKYFGKSDAVLRAAKWISGDKERDQIVEALRHVQATIPGWNFTVETQQTQAIGDGPAGWAHTVATTIFEENQNETDVVRSISKHGVGR